MAPSKNPDKSKDKPEGRKGRAGDALKKTRNARVEKAPVTPTKLRKTRAFEDLKLLSSPSKAGGAALGIPCLKCAKRIIFDKSSKSVTDKERAGSMVDGTVVGGAHACRHHSLAKCAYCRATRKKCAKIVEPGKVRIVDRLVQLANTLVSSRVTSAMREHAVAEQRMVNDVLEGRQQLREQEEDVVGSDVEDSGEESGEGEGELEDSGEDLTPRPSQPRDYDDGMGGPGGRGGSSALDLSTLIASGGA